MLSSITRTKHLCLAVQCISKTEILSSLPCVKLQKAFIMTNSINYRKFDVEQFEAMNRHELLTQKPRTEENFGKIVSLDPEEYEDNLEEVKNMKKKRKRKVEVEHIQTSSHQSIDDLIEEENINEFESDEISNDDKMKLSFSRENKNSHLFRNLMSSLGSAKGRKKKQKIILEGKRLIHEGIAAGFEPTHMFFSRLSDVENFKLSENTKLHKISYKTLKLWSSLVTSQGVVGIFNTPNLRDKPVDLNTIPLTVICDNVRDPGNMGSILRILAGVGCRQLILTKGCVDIWEPKVVRAAAGAHFYLPVYEKMVWSDIDPLISEKNKIFLAESYHNSEINDECDEENKSNERGNLYKTTNSDYDDIPLKCYDSVNYCDGSLTVVIGGETWGLSKEAFEFGKKRNGVRVYIPTTKRIESLNNAIALGVLSFEVRRQFSKILNEPQKEFCETEPEVASGNIA